MFFCSFLTTFLSFIFLFSNLCRNNQRKNNYFWHLFHKPNKIEVLTLTVFQNSYTCAYLYTHIHNHTQAYTQVHIYIIYVCISPFPVEIFFKGVHPFVGIDVQFNLSTLQLSNSSISDSRNFF